jgi:hypothetical protein
VTLFYSRFIDVIVTVHQHALRPGMLLFTWVNDGRGWAQGGPPREVGSIEEARAAMPAWAAPVPVPETFALAGWRA